jgi:hypothetical protein
MISKTEPIHRWDTATLLKSLLFGAVLEAIAIAPIILSPWGHAGPESLWGWLGILLNLPGGCVFLLWRTIFGNWEETISAEAGIVYIYLIQTFIFSYIAFVLLRLKKRKSTVSKLWVAHDGRMRPDNQLRTSSQAEPMFD